MNGTLPDMQDAFVILLVAACLAFVIRQAVTTLRTGKGKLGACCAKGCAAAEEQTKPKPAQVQFLPVDMLLRKK